jgi:hypothetical protein
VITGCLKRRKETVFFFFLYRCITFFWEYVAIFFAGNMQAATVWSSVCSEQGKDLYFLRPFQNSGRNFFDFSPSLRTAEETPPIFFRHSKRQENFSRFSSVAPNGRRISPDFPPSFQTAGEFLPIFLRHSERWENFSRFSSVIPNGGRISPDFPPPFQTTGEITSNLLSNFQ